MRIHADDMPALGLDANSLTMTSPKSTMGTNLRAKGGGNQLRAEQRDAVVMKSELNLTRSHGSFERNESKSQPQRGRPRRSPHQRPGYRCHVNGLWYWRAAFAVRIAPGVKVRVGPRQARWYRERDQTYRVSDNTFIATGGVRRVCRAPFYARSARRVSFAPCSRPATSIRRPACWMTTTRNSTSVRSVSLRERSCGVGRR